MSTIGELFRHASDSLLLDDASLDRLPLGKAWRVQTVNLHHLALARTDCDFADAIARSEWITADGWPVVLMARAVGIRARRVTGSAWVARVLENRSLEGFRVGLVGGSAEAGARFERLLGTPLAFSEHGSRVDWDPKELAARLRMHDAEVLIIAVSPPFGDLLGLRIVESGFLGSIMSVGGGIDMAVGLQRMAPPWARKLGLEWLVRLASAPRRLARRYIVECAPVFFVDVLPFAILEWIKTVRNSVQERGYRREKA